MTIITEITICASVSKAGWSLRFKLFPKTSKQTEEKKNKKKTEAALVQLHCNSLSFLAPAATLQEHHQHSACTSVDFVKPEEVDNV